MSAIHPQLFQSFCDAMPLGVCLVDVEGRIVYWNAGAEGITGYFGHEVLGRAYRGDLLIGCEKCGGDRKNTELYCPVRAVLRDGKAVTAEVFLRHKDGHRLAVQVNAFPLRDATGQMLGVAEILDPSQKNPEAAGWSARSERQFEMTIGLAAVEESREHLQLLVDSPSASQTAVILIEMPEHHAFLRHGGAAMLRQAIRVLARTVAGLVPPRGYVGCWSDDRLIVLLPECSREAMEELMRKLEKVGSSCALKWWGDRMVVAARAAARYLDPVHLDPAHTDPAHSVDALIREMEQELKSGENGE